MKWGTLLWLFVLVGCAAGEADFDGDGASDSSDCRPSDPTAFPGATDPWGDGVDQNCDGVDGLDFDEDGWASAATGGPDCDDTDAGVHPGATEIPDNDVDENCDGEIVWCDLDGDGAVAIVCGGADCDDFDSLCRSEADCTDGDADGFVLCAGDCDEQDATVYPKAEELCDGLDNDCDGELPANEADADGDGVSACAGDCDDDAASAYPGAEETCDGLDSDCDGVVPADEGDGDGDGDPACSDCDDADPLRGTNLPEACDGLDNDCDGVVLPGGANGEFDNDADGVAECGGDCNDFDASIHPGAADGCDGVDTDCNGVVDDVNDLDGDGWCAGDCDDADPTVHPGQWDTPADGVDADCNGDERTDVTNGFATISGSVPGEQCGWRLVGGEDWDGDGIGDLIVSCKYWNDGSGLTSMGRVCLVPGGSIPTAGTTDMSAASWCIESDGSAQFGYDLALGDLDGDGLLDLAASGLGPQRGTVSVFRGSTLAGFAGVHHPINDADHVVQALTGDTSQLGWSLAWVDVDGDGLDGLVIGAPGSGTAGTADPGRVYVLTDDDVVGAAAGVSVETYATAWIDGDADYGYLGRSVAAGDLDGDLADDIVVGAPGINVQGEAHVFFAPQLAGTLTETDATLTVLGDSSGINFSRGLGLIDVDGDALADLVIGADSTSWGGVGAGWVRVWPGGTLPIGTIGSGGGSAAIAYNGGVGEYLGTFSRSADVDGDGFQDLLLSGNKACQTSFSGMAWVLPSADISPGDRPLAWDAAAVFTDGLPGSCLGQGFSGVGDLDGDGRTDLALGAPGVAGDTDLGTVYILISPF